MSLASAMSTALTGLNASETQIDVIGNNLANANTVGFKASDVLFANQFLQTQSVGSSPTATSGGNNPQQQGLGVEVAEITPNFSQGTISTANSPTDLAIQGDGFFIVQGDNGEQNYTRNGTFTTNADSQLVTGTGNRVMGYGVNNNFQVDSSHLQPLSIPLGSAMVAKATTEATLQGALTSSGAIADTASIIQTSPLTDENIEAPSSGPTLTSAPDPNNTGLTGTYSYYVTFVNNNTNVESRPQAVAVTSTSLNNDQVTLYELPHPQRPHEMDGNDRLSQREQSGGRRELLPASASHQHPAGHRRRAGHGQGRHRRCDAHCRRHRQRQHQGLEFRRSPAVPGTLLYNLVQYNSTTETYQKIFPISAAQTASLPTSPNQPPITLGTLTFAGTKGGNTLTTQTFTVMSNTTLGALATFLQGSLGIQPPPGNDPNNPIPVDSVSGQKPGVTIDSDGQINIVGNDGTPNAVSIGLSALQWTPAGSTSSTSTTAAVRPAVQLDPIRRRPRDDDQHGRLRQPGHAALGEHHRRPAKSLQQLPPCIAGMPTAAKTTPATGKEHRRRHGHGQFRRRRQFHLGVQYHRFHRPGQRSRRSTHCNSISIFPKFPALPQLPRR